MNTLMKALTVGAGIALLLSTAARATGLSADSVTLAPGLEDAVRSQYGDQEISALRSQIADAVSRALEGAHGKCNLSIEVELTAVAPSHPTMEQQRRNPSLDPFHTRFANGGASLLGRLYREDGHEYPSVNYQRFSDDLRFTAAGKDPWSDARVSIDQFAQKLASACTHAGVRAGTEGP